MIAVTGTVDSRSALGLFHFAPGTRLESRLTAPQTRRLHEAFGTVGPVATENWARTMSAILGQGG